MHSSEKQVRYVMSHVFRARRTSAGPDHHPHPPNAAEQLQHSREMALPSWRMSFPQQLRQRPSSDSSCSARHTVQFHAPGPLQWMQDG